MKLKKTLIILPLIIALVSCDNNLTSGDNGNLVIHHGHGAPSDSLGNDYDHYFDEDSRYVYEKNGGAWYNKYAKAGNHLINTNTQRRRALTNENDKSTLISALINSFYSTNITCSIDVQLSYSDVSFSAAIDANKYSISIYDTINYLSLDNENNFTVYEINGSLGIQTFGLNEIWHDNIFVPNIIINYPFPSFDSYSYRVFSIYQEDLGEQTSIVISHLNEASFDSETNLYTIQNITVTHGELDGNYCYWYMPGSVTFDFSFRLSEDGSHVEYAKLETTSSTYEYFTYVTLIYNFSNYHNTNVTLPEQSSF